MDVLTHSDLVRENFLKKKKSKVQINNEFMQKVYNDLVISLILIDFIYLFDTG